jgi:hypothetical protein
MGSVPFAGIYAILAQALWRIRSKMSVPITSSTALWQRLTRSAAAWHRLKRWIHIAARLAKNAVYGPRHIERGETLAQAPVMAEHRSPLWLEGRDDTTLD